MKDPPTRQRVALLHPAVRTWIAGIIEALEAANPFVVRVVQGFRTFEEQADIYAQGRTKPGKRVSDAKPGTSLHNYGLAIDFAIMYDLDGNGSFETLSWDLVKDLDRDGAADWKEVVTAFVAAGFEWGGNWHTLKDNPHLQKTFGNDYRTLLKRYQVKDFVPGTTYVRL